MTVTALALVRLRNLFAVIMLASIFSLLAAALYVVMDAVDVAFTEAAVGAGISTVLMLGTLALTTKEEKRSTRRNLGALLIVTVTGGLLVSGTLDMPSYGDPDAPIHHHVVPRYIKASGTEVGIPNIVTSVLASYRGYDTLGEVTVILTAAIGVMMLIGRGRRPKSKDKTTAPVRTHAMKLKSILRVISKLLIPAIMLFALYVQFHGDFGPGGGFQAGVLFASAIILYALIFDVDIARKVVPAWATRILLAAGLLLYAGVGIAGMLMGGNYLNYSVLAGEPANGQHLGITLIEFGVGTTVAAAMITIFLIFAGQSQSQEDR